MNSQTFPVEEMGRGLHGFNGLTAAESAQSVAHSNLWPFHWSCPRLDSALWL